MFRDYFYKRNVNNVFIRLVCAVVAAALAACLLTAPLNKSAVFSYADAKAETAEKLVRKKTANVKKPDVAAVSCGVYCANTGETLFSKNPDAKIKLAGISRFFVAAAAAQRLPLDREITVSEEAAGKKGGMGLQKGEKVTSEDLLAGTLLMGADDAAYALSEEMSGNVKNLASLMTGIARDAGLKDTVFRDPVIDGGKSVTTGADLEELITISMESPYVVRLFSLDEYTVPATSKTKPRKLTPSGWPAKLRKIRGVEGALVSSDEGGKVSAVIYYEKEGLRLYAFLAGEDKGSLLRDVQNIMEYSGSVPEGYRVVKAGTYEGKARVLRGSVRSVAAETGEAGYVYLPAQGSNSLISTKVEFKAVKAPVKKGDEVGSFIIMVGGAEAERIPLIATGNVPRGWVTSYIGVPDSVALIVVIVVIILALMISVRRVRIYRKKRKRAAERQKKIRELAEKELEREEREEEEHNRRGWHF